MQKFNLKDKYSHNLGNALQAIYTPSDLLSSFQLNKKEEEQLKVTLSDTLQEATKLLKEIREF